MDENNQTPTQQPESPISDVQNTQSPEPSTAPEVQTPQSPQSTQIPTPEASATEVQSQPPVEPEKPKSNKMLFFGVILLLVAIAGTAAYLFFNKQNNLTPQPNSYEECVRAEGSVIQESYPATCVTKDGERFTQPLSEEEQQNLQPPTLTPTPDPFSGWKTYTSSTYTFKYPSDFELKEPEGGMVVLSKWGPTQKADTEFYDGISLNFMPREIPSITVENFVQNKIDEIKTAGIAEVTSGPTSVTVNKYSGLTYTTVGLGTFKNIVIQTDDGVMFMEITNSTVDPGNLGFANTVNQILDTFEFIE